VYDPAMPAPPPPPPPEAMGGNARYVYLLGRLRSRQITMEEATELFALQQAMLRTATARAPPRPAPAGAPVASPSPMAAVMTSGLSDDGFAWALLALGVGAGLLAATAKRARAPEPPSAPR
jgi:hypothetical protein